MTIHLEVTHSMEGEGFVYHHVECGGPPMTRQEFEGRFALGISPSRLLFCECGLRISYLTFGEAASTMTHVVLDGAQRLLPIGTFNCSRADEIMIVPRVPVEWV
jgi:hypothetical protein